MIVMSLRSMESEQPAKGITGNGRFAIAMSPERIEFLNGGKSEAVVWEKPAKNPFRTAPHAERPPGRPQYYVRRPR